jgi:hypothetical protein
LVHAPVVFVQNQTVFYLCNFRKRSECRGAALGAGEEDLVGDWTGRKDAYFGVFWNSNDLVDSLQTDLVVPYPYLILKEAFPLYQPLTGHQKPYFSLLFLHTFSRWCHLFVVIFKVQNQLSLSFPPLDKAAYLLLSDLRGAVDKVFVHL